MHRSSLYLGDLFQFQISIILALYLKPLFNETNAMQFVEHNMFVMYPKSFGFWFCGYSVKQL